MGSAPTPPVQVSWIPGDFRSAKGGQFSNATSNSADTTYLSLVTDLIVDQKKWFPRAADTGYGGAGFIIRGSPHPLSSLAIFNSYAGNGQTLYSNVVGYETTSNTVWDVTGGVGIDGPRGNHGRPVFQSVKNRMFYADGDTTGAGPKKPRIISSSVGVLGCAQWGQIAPTAPLTATWTNQSIGTSNVVNGNPNITFAAGTNYASLSVGGTIYLGGVPYVIQVVAPAAITLTTNYAAPNGVVAHIAGFGALSWTAGLGYMYAISYWNTVTGHISNLGQILAVNDGPPNNDRVSLIIGNIIRQADGSFPAYDKIILWRTAKGGGFFYPLTTFVNTVPGVVTYTDNQGDDTQLGTVAPGKVIGPTGTNLPPPDDLNHIAYWDERFWGSSNGNIGVLYFSARSSTGEIPCGVAEESWPGTYYRAVPESDGRITGTCVVGNTLFIETDNSIYQVVGYDPGSYTMRRVTAKGNGTSHFACCRLAAEDTQGGDVLVHYGNDRRLYMLYMSGADVPISYPIQDRLNTINAPASDANVSIMHSRYGTFIVLSFITANYSFLFDLDRMIWFTTTIPSQSHCEGLLNGSLVFLAAGGTANGTPANGTVSTVMSSASPVTSVTWRSQNINVPGVERSLDKTLQAVAVTSTDTSTSFTVKVYPDEGSAVTLTFVDPGTDPRWANLSDPYTRVYIPQNVSLKGNIFQVEVTYTPATFNTDIREVLGVWTVDGKPGNVFAGIGG